MRLDARRCRTCKRSQNVLPANNASLVVSETSSRKWAPAVEKYFGPIARGRSPSHNPGAACFATEQLLRWQRALNCRAYTSRIPPCLVPTGRCCARCPRQRPVSRQVEPVVQAAGLRPSNRERCVRLSGVGATRSMFEILATAHKDIHRGTAQSDRRGASQTPSASAHR